MNSVKARPTTPKVLDTMVRRLLSHLSVSPSSAQWLSYHKPCHFTPESGECHINAWIQWKYEKSGSTLSGWVIWQHKEAEFVEAEFHTVWRRSDGVLVDVTPRHDGEQKILFVPDPVRAIRTTECKGSPAICTFSNARMQHGKLVSSPQEQIRILTTNLIYEHGLATRTGAP